MYTSRLFAGVCVGVMLLSTMCCGGNGPDCGVNGLNVGPSTATVDHMAAAPGNSQTFNASFQVKNNSGCPAVTAALVNSNWTVSDPSVHLSSSPSTHVTATCTAAVSNPVAITATPADGEMFIGKASLTCN